MYKRKIFDARFLALFFSRLYISEKKLTQEILRQEFFAPLGNASEKSQTQSFCTIFLLWVKERKDQDDTTWSAWPRVRGTWCQKDDKVLSITMNYLNFALNLLLTFILAYAFHFRPLDVKLYGLFWAKFLINPSPLHHL